MSTLNVYLQNELLALSNEAKRKHPEVKEASEQLISIIRISKDKSEKEFAEDLSRSSEVLKPFALACDTKIPKLLIISVGCLQRLILNSAINESYLEKLVWLLLDICSSGIMDVQLKSLQLILPLITNYPCIQGTLLNSAILLCFKLQDTKSPIVNNTASAMLRQILIVTFEKVPKESLELNTNALKSDVDKNTKSETQPMSQELKDAYWIFHDICSMINGDTPVLLKLPNLNKSFGLELLESILKSHPELFQTSPDLSKCLKNKLCPILIRSFSEKTEFMVAMRILRLVLLVIKHYHESLVMEVEIFITMLIKILEPENHLWYRVLAAEIFWYLCRDIELLQWFYTKFDKENQADCPKLYRDIISAVGKLSTEKPTSHGIVIPISNLRNSAPDPNLSATFHGADAQWGLTYQGASLKVKCIDQLDKTEPPQLPENYLLFLCLNSFHALIDGQCRLGSPAFCQSQGFQYDSQGSPTRAEFPRDQSGSVLPQVKINPQILQSPDIIVLADMASITWPGLLASLSFFIKLPMDEELSFVVVNSLQNFTHLCGVLNLTTPREAFLTCLYRNSFPYLAAYSDGQDPNGTMAHNTSNTVNAPPTLNSNHILYIQALLNIASSLAECLGSSWFLILDAIQHIQHFLNAGYKVYHRQIEAANAKSSSPYSANGKESPNTGETDLSDLRIAIKRLLDNVKYLSDSAFEAFLKSLCRLCADSAGVPFTLSTTLAETESESTQSETKGRGVTVRRQLFKQSDVLSSIDQLRTTCLSSLSKLISQDPPHLWNLIVHNLIRITNGILTPPGIKVQACQTINEILISGYNCAASLKITHQTRVQLQVLSPLAMWMGIPAYGAESGNGLMLSDVGGQCAALETLDKLLQNSGPSFTDGWKIIFDILSAASSSLINPQTSPFKTESNKEAVQPMPMSPNSSKSNRIAELIRNAFRCLQLISNEFLSQLTPARLKDCIFIVSQFGSQKEDLNTSLTAIGMLWNVLDYIQRKHSELPKADTDISIQIESIKFQDEISDDTTSYTLAQLWLSIVFKLSELAYDTRPEVRHASIQTFFRGITMAGSLTSHNLWLTCLKDILFPMLENVNQIYFNIIMNSGDSSHRVIDTLQIVHHSRNSAKKQWDETRALLLNGVVAVYQEKLADLYQIPDFEYSWNSLLQYIRDSALIDSKEISLAALTNFNKLVSNPVGIDSISSDIKGLIYESSWRIWLDIGTLITDDTQTTLPYRTVAYNPCQETDNTKTIPKITKVSQVIFTKFMEIFPNLYKNNRNKIHDDDWTQVVQIIQNIAQYIHSEDFKPDAEFVSPLQDSILQALKPLEFELASIPQPFIGILLMKSYSHFVSLAMEDQEVRTTRIQQQLKADSKMVAKIPTYLALAQMLTENIPTLFASHNDVLSLYVDGIFDEILNSLTIPMTNRYQCPSSKSENLPLWKEITRGLVSIIGKAIEGIDHLIDEIPNDTLNRILNKILDTLSQILWSSTPPPSLLTAHELDKDECFDMENLIKIFIYINSFLHHEVVSTDVITKFINILEKGSHLSSIQDGVNSYSGDSTPPTSPANREQLSFVYLKCLVALCISPEYRLHEADSNTKIASANKEDRTSNLFQGVQSSAVNYDQMFAAEVPERVTKIASPILLTRCQTILGDFADAFPTFGKRPLPRVLREEIMFLLARLTQIQLEPNACKALFKTRESPSPFLPAILESPLAHLFLFYPVFHRLLACKDPEIIILISKCFCQVGEVLGLN